MQEVGERREGDCMLAVIQKGDLAKRREMPQGAGFRARHDGMFEEG